MCFDYDEYATVYGETTRRARRDHTCCGCGRKITRGQLYVYGSGVFDGAGFSRKICGACRVDQRSIDVYERTVEGCKYPYSWPDPSDVAGWFRHHEGFRRATVEEGQSHLSATLCRRYRPFYRATITEVRQCEH